MLVSEDEAPKAGKCVVCDMCGDRIYDLTKGLTWFRPPSEDGKQRGSVMYFAHPGKCFENATRFLNGDIGYGPLLPVLRRLSHHLVRGYDIPPEQYEILDPPTDAGGGLATEPERKPWELLPEDVASHSVQLRLLWNTVTNHWRQNALGELSLHELADAIWSSPGTVSDLIFKAKTPHLRPLEAARLFRHLHEEAGKVGLLPVKRGKLVIG